jgi:hypothetical protein
MGVLQEIVGIYLVAIFAVPMYPHKTLLYSFDEIVGVCYLTVQRACRISPR